MWPVAGSTRATVPLSPSAIHNEPKSNTIPWPNRPPGSMSLAAAGPRNAPQRSHGRGDPTILAAVNLPRSGLRETSRPVVGDLPSIRSSPDPLAGLRPHRDVVRVSKLVLHGEILLDDRSDVALH